MLDEKIYSASCELSTQAPSVAIDLVCELYRLQIAVVLPNTVRVTLQTIPHKGHFIVCRAKADL